MRSPVGSDARRVAGPGADNTAFPDDEDFVELAADGRQADPRAAVITDRVQAELPAGPTNDPDKPLQTMRLARNA